MIRYFEPKKEGISRVYSCGCEMNADILASGYRGGVQLSNTLQLRNIVPVFVVSSMIYPVLLSVNEISFI